MGFVFRVLVVGAAVLGLAAPVHAGAIARGTAPHIAAAAVVPAEPARAVAEPQCRAGLVALTFDDGPVPDLTPKLVQILQHHHVPATFFMVGRRVHASPGTAQLVAGAGFVIGNHTWSHPELTRLPDPAIRREIRTTARELRHDGIPRSTLMRPPYGEIDARVRADVHALGLVPVLWNVDSEDWRGGSARQIADSILGQLQRHRDNIVLQHDGVPNSPASVAAVPRVIREARRRGYCFGSLGPHGHVQPPGDVPSEPARVAATPAPRVHARPVTATPFDVVLTRAAT